MEEGVRERAAGTEMAEKQDFLAFAAETLKLKPMDAGVYSPLVLAYIGDAVYELVIRTRIVNQGNIQVNKMHKKSAGLVKAGTQAAMARLLLEELTPEEQAIYKRGRNAKSVTVAKHASVADYRAATGFEALMGYLYLSGQYRRMILLIQRGLENLPDDGR